MNAELEIQIKPSVHDEKKMLEIIDKVIEYIISTGLSYHVGPFETTVEGDLDQLLEIIKVSHTLSIEAGAPAVNSAMKLYYSPEQHLLTTDEKISKYSK